MHKYRGLSMLHLLHLAHQIRLTCGITAMTSIDKQAIFAYAWWKIFRPIALFLSEKFTSLNL